jgi:hypothetical protein
MQRVEDFIKQVDRVDFLNLFLSSLSDEDVTTTLFATMYTTDKPEDNPTTGVATPAPAKGTKGAQSDCGVSCRVVSCRVVSCRVFELGI